MKSWYGSVLAAIVVCGVAGPTAATVTRMGDTLEEAVAYLQGLAPASECVFGHLELPTQVSTAGVGLDTAYYALTGRPHVDCPGCAVGFRVHAIHFLTYVGGPSGGYYMQVGLADPEFHEGSCFAPPPYSGSSGNLDCGTGFVWVELPSAGFYDVALPIECGCAENSFYPYLVTFGPVAPPPHDVLLDSHCDACQGWTAELVSTSVPWWDRCNLADSGGGYPGDVVYYVEADCCEPPVRGETSSWTRLKALFGH